MLPNKKLNDLRNEVSQDSKIEYDIASLLEKTKRIHIRWLFDIKYLPLLQKLCRFLDGYYDTPLTPGWKTFGHHLGLSMEILRVIDCSKLGYEGYTYYLLQHYAEKDDSTIHGVVQALLNIKRLDVIQETHKYVNSLADDILSANGNQQGQDDSGYYSGTTNSGETLEDAVQENQRPPTLVENIIKPGYELPKPALVLRVLKKEIQIASCLPQPPKLEHVNLVTSAPERKPPTVVAPQQPQKKVQKYDCTVLLTFAGDGIHFAREVARNLRARQEDNRTIGVLMLNEHETLVERNPEDFIYSVFSQVDYVIPIITEGYLQGIVDTSSPWVRDDLYIDCKYVRFIFTLMRKYYVQNGCLNKKIRCIIPDNLIHLARKTLMRDPIFETWVRSSSVENLAARMIRRCIKKNCEQIIEA